MGMTKCTPDISHVVSHPANMGHHLLLGTRLDKNNSSGTKLAPLVIQGMKQASEHSLRTKTPIKPLKYPICSALPE
jgi:hypothetical protein